MTHPPITVEEWIGVGVIIAIFALLIIARKLKEEYYE